MENHDNHGVAHVTPSGGNVFADLGFEQKEAEDLKIKSQLLMEISKWVREHHLKQAQAAEALEISRPRVSDIMTGKAWKFTIDMLVKLLERIGKRVRVLVSDMDVAPAPA